MSHLRWDPTLQEWVVYARQRQDRTFLPPAEWCPLCPTRAGTVPAEIPAGRYEIVVLGNRFPGLSSTRTPTEDAPEDAYRFGCEALVASRPGDGICEVVLYTDDHSTILADMSEQRIGQLVEVWTDRYHELGARWATKQAVHAVIAVARRGWAEVGYPLCGPCWRVSLVWRV
jgi:UDPglucose--hexose-1-phosphate uridylyltransferase